MSKVMNEMEVSVQQEIDAPLMAKPHVVLLGAGASKAALPHGDRSGRQVPLLRDVAAELQLANKFPADLRELADSDFEAAYSQLFDRDRGLTAPIDAEVQRYFANLALPDEPTMYDNLMLSLRAKDVILTFNWDPFVMQARKRLVDHGVRQDQMPDVQFLHGNVMAGYCAEHKVRGLIGLRCRTCGQPLVPSRLLFPVEHKNYQDGSMIEQAWNAARDYLEDCLVFTVFGYSAPTTDVEAIDLLKQAWGEVDDRRMEQIEIIGRPGADEEELRKRWNRFIHTHHYDVFGDFYESWAADHPRRSAEAYKHQYLDAKFVSANPVPQSAATLEELVRWYRPLFEAEQRYYDSL